MMPLELPSAWTMVPLGSLGDWYGGGTPRKSNSAFWDGDIPWVSPKDVKVARLLDTADHISADAIKASPAKLIGKRSVLVVMRSGILANTLPVSINEVPMTINQDLKAITPFEGIDVEYLAWALCAFQRQILNQCSKHGTTVHSIELPRFRCFEIPVAPRREQQRIVAKIDELFSELDKGIESLKTAQVKLKIYRQALLKQAFEGKLTAQWREKNKNKLETAEKLLARIKWERTARAERQLKEWKTAVNEWNERGKHGIRPSRPRKTANLLLDPDAIAKLPPLSEGQAYTSLANLGELGRGKSKHRPRNAPELFGGPYPFIQTGEVKAAGRIIREYSKTYSERGLEQSMLWPQGTLCITIAANIAETAFLGFDGCFPDSVVGFTADTKLVLPEYVELFIKSVRTRIEAYAPATAQKNINLTTLENLVVPICSLAEQRALVDRLEAILTAIDDQEALIDTQLLRAGAFRQSILDKAFSGELVEQDPNDEPAAALLKRIKAEKASQKLKAKTRQRKAANA